MLSGIIIMKLAAEKLYNEDKVPGLKQQTSS
jgi:hypothetical protein